MIKIAIALSAILAACAVPASHPDDDPAISTVESDLRSQCWSGTGWWQCRVTSDDETTGVCCRAGTQDGADDSNCWSW